MNIHLQHFDKEKSMEAILYVANRLQRRDFHKIFKILYFADRSHLSKYARTITDDTYIAMNDGPVPSNIYDIFKAVRGDGFFSDKVPYIKELISVTDWNFIEPHRDADTNILSESDCEELDESIRLYGTLSWDEIREKSHDYAWRNTQRDYPIDVKNILLETGESKEYIEYVSEMMSISEV